ncbi:MULTISPECIES: response regulator transcription factor [unclassified Arenimonas]|uniref:response regulator n=1 Tax=unclassified Arenimonas TaxID=2641713 RepID=UPI000869C912|nr:MULTISPECIES: response regulator transcription factor [unclassified Arenimonas]ODS63480.1 MAG: DNA-binding response regulator [Arenimonas sp. SCN 70-307]
MNKPPGCGLRVLIADDHTLVRESIISVLEAAGVCEVVGQASNGLDAIALAEQLQPAVAVIDISMPHLGGLEVVRRLRTQCPDTRVLVLTMHDDQEYLLHAVRAGASGFLLKDSPAAEMVAAVRNVGEGRGHFSPQAARLLAEQLRQPDRTLDDPYGSLTPREREVFHLMVEGLSTKEIARRLGTSTKTAENHRARVLAKLGARNTADVIRYAARRGLMD